ncbi:MAG: DUF3299 domain-containing protein [Myxococcota bacterium]
MLVTTSVGCTADNDEAPVSEAEIETEIGWTALSAMDVKSGKKPDSLTKTLENPIRIHGYGVAVEFDENGVSSFLLVPDASFCVHVPPPPPNQIVLVELKTPIHWRLLESGIWLTGTLDVERQESEFGGFMYKMKKLVSIERAEW